MIFRIVRHLGLYFVHHFSAKYYFKPNCPISFESLLQQAFSLCEAA